MNKKKLLLNFWTRSILNATNTEKRGVGVVGGVGGGGGILFSFL